MLRTPGIHRIEGCVGWVGRLVPTDGLHVLNNNILTGCGAHSAHSAPYSVGTEHLFLQQRGGPGADVKNEWSFAHTSWPGHRKLPDTSQSLRCNVLAYKRRQTALTSRRYQLPTLFRFVPEGSAITLRKVNMQPIVGGLPSHPAVNVNSKPIRWHHRLTCRHINSPKPRIIFVAFCRLPQGTLHTHTGAAYVLTSV